MVSDSTKPSAVLKALQIGYTGFICFHHAMVDSIEEIFKLLPRFEDIEELLQNEAEARYILKRAADYFEKSNSNGEEEEISYLIRALVDKTWERIHSGHFSSVSLTIRKIYALGCYFKVI